MKGRIVYDTFLSEALEGNPLGDPYMRGIPVYLPPGHNKGKFPVAFLLAGYSGRGQSMMNVSAWEETVPEMIDRLIVAKQIRPFIVVFPDCWTTLGGSQYLDSWMGGYQSYLLELAEFVDKTRNTLGPSHRAIVGHSSGGFGALSMGFCNPLEFPYVADHAGDKAFELCYKAEFPKVCDAVNRAFLPVIDRKVINIDEVMKYASGWPRHDSTKVGAPGASPHFVLMNFAAMCAAYTEPGERIQSPIASFHDCRIDEDVWARWKTYDPCYHVDRTKNPFEGLKFVYMDCGENDEYGLQYGARQFSEAVKDFPLAPFHYEEFPGGHRRTSYRYGRSLQVIGEQMPM